MNNWKILRRKNEIERKAFPIMAANNFTIFEIWSHKLFIKRKKAKTLLFFKIIYLFT